MGAKRPYRTRANCRADPCELSERHLRKIFKPKSGTRKSVAFGWWEEVDSNYRSRRRQIYSLIHLAALESSRIQLMLRPRTGSGKTNGAGDWNRTHNLLITNQLLCQLSYTSTVGASGRNRTTDTGIFSPLLYRLSYRGILKPAWQPTYAIKQAFSKEWRPGTVSNRRPPA